MFSINTIKTKQKDPRKTSTISDLEKLIAIYQKKRGDTGEVSQHNRP
jgi:hypothetical protein